MREGRDFVLVHRINGHFADLNEDLSGIASVGDFASSKEKRRAILFDFMQIGELMNQLSRPFIHGFDHPSVPKLVSIRNRIVHGYGTVRDDIVFMTLKTELAPFISELNAFARKEYRQRLRALLGKRLTVFVDRPIGYDHNGIVYPLNYGYVEELTALDGEYQDAYVVGCQESVREIRGTAIAIVERHDDIEDKLVVTTTDGALSDDEIERLVDFQERFFAHSIARK